jgi:hypothetical protein
MSVLKIKITGPKIKERENLQRCISRFLHHNDVPLIESIKEGSTVKQIITTPNPDEGLPSVLTLVECDNTTQICRTDLRLIAEATGDTEANVEAKTHRSWHVSLKMPGKGQINRIVTAQDPADAIKKLGFEGPFEFVNVKAC